MFLVGTLIFPLKAFCEVSYIETTAKGKAETLEIALKKALKEAISKVNGVTLKTESILETIDKSLITEDSASSTLSRDLKEKISEKSGGSIKSFDILNEYLLGGPTHHYTSKRFDYIVEYIQNEFDWDAERIAEEVNNLAAISFELEYNASLVQIDSIVVGDYIGENGESIFYKEINNSTGLASVITALLGSNSPTLTGTASIAKIYLTVKTTGLSQIEFDGTETFRNVDNGIININSAIGGIIDQN